MTLSASMNCSPFIVFEQDTDEVIMIINYYIEVGDEQPQKQTAKNKKEERIRVNDKTATGGWF